MSNRTDISGVDRGGSSSRSSGRGGAQAQPDLAELMRLYVEGDTAAYEQLFRLLSPRIFGFHVRSTGNKALAQDLTQQTFLKLHVARQRFKPGAPLEPWLFAIAKNVQRDHLRKRQRSREYLTDEGELPATIESGVRPTTTDPFLRDQIARAIFELPEGQRDVLILHKLEGFSMEEVSKTLNIGVSAAKVRAFRAYKALRKQLGQEVA